MRGRWKDGPRFLSEFASLEAWEQRVAAIGHGSPTDMDAAEALDIARAATPETPSTVDPDDPQGLAAGMHAAVVPAGDGGDPPVVGSIHFADRETIGLGHDNDRVGTVCINFPRVGFDITAPVVA